MSMKTPQEQKTITRQVSRRLEELRGMQKTVKGIDSWIDYIRLGLGMSLNQLAQRVGVAQSSLSGSVKLEKEGRITVNKLKEIAEAMDCELIYGFVPKKKIEDLIRDQAKLKSTHLMEQAETHMSLEDQKVTLDKQERLKDLIEDKIYSKYLWDK